MSNPQFMMFLMNRRNRTLREHDRKVIADLKARNYSNEAIVDWFRDNYGRVITLDTVRSDLKAMYAEWAKEVIDDLTPYMQEQLLANERLTERAWQRYELAEQRLDAVSPDEYKPRQVALSEVTYWFNQVVKLRDSRSRLLNLDRAGIQVNIDNRQQSVQVVEPPPPVKGYITVSPDHWPAEPAELPAIEAETGIYEDIDA